MRALLSLALLVLAFSPALADEPDAAEGLLEQLVASLPDSLSLDGKVVYVDFWASWCVPCRKSFPWMESMVERHADEGLQIVTVNLDKKEALAHRFLDELSSTLSVVYDPEGKLAERGRLEAMPTALIFGRDGAVAARHEGFRTEDQEELEAFLHNLLAQEVAP